MDCSVCYGLGSGPRSAPMLSSEQCGSLFPGLKDTPSMMHKNFSGIFF